MEVQEVKKMEAANPNFVTHNRAADNGSIRMSITRRQRAGTVEPADV